MKDTTVPQVQSIPHPTVRQNIKMVQAPVNTAAAANTRMGVHLVASIVMDIAQVVAKARKGAHQALPINIVAAALVVNIRKEAVAQVVSIGKDTVQAPVIPKTSLRAHHQKREVQALVLAKIKIDTKKVLVKMQKNTSQAVVQVTNTNQVVVLVISISQVAVQVTSTSQAAAQVIDISQVVALLTSTGQAVAQLKSIGMVPLANTRSHHPNQSIERKKDKKKIRRTEQRGKKNMKISEKNPMRSSRKRLWKSISKLNQDLL